MCACVCLKVARGCADPRGVEGGSRKNRQRAAHTPLGFHKLENRVFEFEDHKAGGVILERLLEHAIDEVLDPRRGTLGTR